MVGAVKKADALARYANDTHQLAAAAGVTRQAVEQWGEVVPWRSAVELERVSNGHLKVDTELYRTKKKREAAG